jgi:oleate hydratase
LGEPSNRSGRRDSGLLKDRPGDFIKKTMQVSTGEEFTQEWLFHVGVPVEDIPELAATGATVCSS